MPSLNIIGNINLTGGKYNRAPFTATGGQITTFTSGGIDYTSHTFTSSGVFTIISGETTAQLLAVGAGGKGQGGGAPNAFGNGGGGGGIAYTSSFFLRKNLAGGPSTFIAQVAGFNTNEGTTPAEMTSSFTSTYGYEQIAQVIAFGGGNGQQSGASGGGQGGLAIYGVQGNNGGTSPTSGGGGAGEVGSSALSGDGGDGLAFTLQDGTSKYYAGGGAGGGYSNISRSGGAGGLGGGGNGGSGVRGGGAAGAANTGGGGGGGNTANDAADRGGGGDGGSGVIIICYPTNG